MPSDAPQGLCPNCLVNLNFATETVLSGDLEASEGAWFSAEELARKLPQFENFELLGRGAMGVVYKARQKALDRDVALKILAPERVTNPAFAQHFQREARLLARLNHPNIVTVHDFGQVEDLFYLVMEFVDGATLRQVLAEGKLAPKEALAIVPPICEALQVAHDHGIVHRDIKPENLLLDREGRIKVADFGIARLLAAETAGEKPSGTPQYMAPEQSAAGGQVDHRADIYALGVVLYEMLTGERPGDKLSPPSRKVNLDVRIDEIVLRALEKEPSRRYLTAGEFKTHVETVAEGAGAGGGEGGNRFSRWCRRNAPWGAGRWFAGMAMGCGCFMAFVFLFFVAAFLFYVTAYMSHEEVRDEVKRGVTNLVQAARVEPVKYIEFEVALANLASDTGTQFLDLDTGRLGAKPAGFTNDAASVSFVATNGYDLAFVSGGNSSAWLRFGYPGMQMVRITHEEAMLEEVRAALKAGPPAAGPGRTDEPEGWEALPIDPGLGFPQVFAFRTGQGCVGTITLRSLPESGAPADLFCRLLDGWQSPTPPASPAPPVAPGAPEAPLPSDEPAANPDGKAGAGGQANPAAPNR